MRGTVVVAAIGAALLLTGCGTGSVTGRADAEGAAAGEPAFSPCDDIPDDVIIAQGFDAASESRDILGTKQPGWNVCGWNGPESSLSILASTKTLDDVRQNDRNDDVVPLELGDRAAFSYREETSTGRESCDVALGTADGVVLISVGFHVLTPPATEDQPCAIAVRVAHAIDNYVPR